MAVCSEFLCPGNAGESAGGRLNPPTSNRGTQRFLTTHALKFKQIKSSKLSCTTGRKADLTQVNENASEMKASLRLWLRTNSCRPKETPSGLEIQPSFSRTIDSSCSRQVHLSGPPREAAQQSSHFPASQTDLCRLLSTPQLFTYSMMKLSGYAEVRATPPPPSALQCISCCYPTCLVSSDQKGCSLLSPRRIEIKPPYHLEHWFEVLGIIKPKQSKCETHLLHR